MRQGAGGRIPIEHYLNGLRYQYCRHVQGNLEVQRLVQRWRSERQHHGRTIEERVRNDRSRRFGAALVDRVMSRLLELKLLESTSQ